ncbi:hypothetical protein [Alkaliphilus transvaalensis]|uniref:hypothetical protein n=1 Tax=Alkaliphilus transvaalensis TaxID=114628 RepID=UPI00047C21A0|nr:hypothetical protein [Alkaliphilus transvaalensis]
MQEEILELSDNEVSITKEKYEQRGYVTLPVCEEDFKDFICGILGETQSLEGRLFGKFDVGLQDIKNLYYLIQQRVEQQNKSKLIQFITKIIYHDNSSITLNSFDELCTFNEVKPVVPSSVHIKWVYLIQFENKRMAEKQEIEVSIVRDKVLKRKHYEDFIVNMINRTGFIEYRIKHSARTWGVDIEALLTTQIKGLLTESNRFKTFLMEKSGTVGTTISLSLFATSIAGIYIATKSFTNNAMLMVNSNLNNNLTTVEDKLNFIGTYIANGDWFKFNNSVILFAIIMLVVSLIIGIWISEVMEITESSFINLTEESKKFKNKQIKKQNRQLFKFIASIFLSILTSVFANFIFYYLN